MSSLVIERFTLVVRRLSTEGLAQLGWAYDTHTRVILDEDGVPGIFFFLFVNHAPGTSPIM